MVSDDRFDNPHDRAMADEMVMMRKHVSLLEERDEINLQVIASLVAENKRLRDQLNGRSAMDNLNLLSYLYETRQ